MDINKVRAKVMEKLHISEQEYKDDVLAAVRVDEVIELIEAFVKLSSELEKEGIKNKFTMNDLGIDYGATE